MDNTDTILKIILREIRDSQFGDEISPINVFLFATKLLCIQITKEEIEAAMQRKLSQKLRSLSLDKYIEEYEEEVMIAIRKAMAEQEINHPLQDANDFNKIPWAGYCYASLEAIHQVLYLYGAPNLLYES
jgi:hypothetical protein